MPNPADSLCKMKQKMPLDLVHACPGDHGNSWVQSTGNWWRGSADDSFKIFCYKIEQNE